MEFSRIWALARDLGPKKKEGRKKDKPKRERPLVVPAQEKERLTLVSVALDP